MEIRQSTENGGKGGRLGGDQGKEDPVNSQGHLCKVKLKGSFSLGQCLRTGETVHYHWRIPSKYGVGHQRLT